MTDNATQTQPAPPDKAKRAKKGSKQGAPEERAPADVGSEERAPEERAPEVIPLPAAANYRSWRRDAPPEGSQVQRDSAESEARWSCTVCEEVNRISRPRCNNCFAERPATIRAAETVDAAANASPGVGRRRVDQQGLRKAARMVQEALLNRRVRASSSTAAEPTPGAPAEEPTPGDAAAAALVATIATTAILRAAGAEAPHRLRALIAALRTNAELRAAVLRAGAPGAEALATQDPLEWANDGTKAQRLSWERECLAQASQIGGDVRPCPECGGRAVVETGSFPAFKMAKNYVMWRCTELSCGKVTNLRE